MKNNRSIINQKDSSIKKVKSLLDYTKTNKSQYSGKEYDSGYHTLKVLDLELKGQRNPSERLKNIPFDFTGKTVLDIGCNQGGMLFCVQDSIYWGVGIDYDHKMVNVANKIRSVSGYQNLDFYILDVEREPIELIEDFLPFVKIDIIFLLSVCMWIHNWREILVFCASRAEYLLFESNGSDLQQQEQIEFIKNHFSEVTLIRGSSFDDPFQKNRRLYLCRSYIFNAF